MGCQLDPINTRIAPLWSYTRCCIIFRIEKRLCILIPIKMIVFIITVSLFYDGIRTAAGVYDSYTVIHNQTLIFGRKRKLSVL